MDEDRLARIVDAIGAGGEPDPETYPQRVCDASADLLGVSGAGLTLMAEEMPSKVWASDTASRAVEDLQFALGEGPALDACRWRAPTLEPSLAASSRWPFFGPRAMCLGVQAVFSFPLQVGLICLGAVNLFHDCPGYLSRDELVDALVLADVVTEHLIDLQAQGVLQWGTEDGPSRQARVHQATGMVSVQIGADISTALARMRAYGFANEMSIFKVADMVLDRTLRLSPHTLQ